MSDMHFYSHGRYSGVGRRIAALTIDSIIVAFIIVPVAFAIQRILDDQVYDGVDWFAASSVATLLYLGYFIVLEGRSGATLGKRMLGLRVEHTDATPCTMKASLIRNALRVIDGFPFFFAPGVPPLYVVGGVMVMYSSRRQRLGDWAAETVVVLSPAAQTAKGRASGKQNSTQVRNVPRQKT